MSTRNPHRRNNPPARKFDTDVNRPKPSHQKVQTLPLKRRILPTNPPHQPRPQLPHPKIPLTGKENSKTRYKCYRPQNAPLEKFKPPERKIPLNVLPLRDIIIEPHFPPECEKTPTIHIIYENEEALFPCSGFFSVT